MRWQHLSHNCDVFLNPPPSLYSSWSATVWICRLCVGFSCGFYHDIWPLCEASDFYSLSTLWFRFASGVDRCSSSCADVSTGAGRCPLLLMQQGLAQGGCVYELGVLAGLSSSASALPQCFEWLSSYGPIQISHHYFELFLTHLFMFVRFC